jgi:polyribonucleotide nucleotidyltransferase
VIGKKGAYISEIQGTYGVKIIIDEEQGNAGD